MHAEVLQKTGVHPMAMLKYGVTVFTVCLLVIYAYTSYVTLLAPQEAAPLVVPMRQASQWWGVGKWAFSDITGMGLHWCRIPKCMSTMTQLVLCDLLKMYRAMPYTEALGMRENDCVQKLWYQDAATGKKTWETPTANTDFAIVRDPLERFVSLYEYVCVTRRLCSDASIHQFARGVYNMMRFGASPSFINESFVQDVRYHAQPQSWFCDIRLRPQNYNFVKHSKDKEQMYSQLTEVFRKAKIPDNNIERALKQVRLSFANENPKNATDYAEAKREILRDRLTLDYITKTYHFDYTLLGFNIPTRGETLLEVSNGHPRE